NKVQNKQQAEDKEQKKEEDKTKETIKKTENLMLNGDAPAEQQGKDDKSKSPKDDKKKG
ncbi:hypothetical protein KCU90_g17844, partial [Aureobasidium melanogenum]